MISEAIKPLQLFGQAAEFKFESKFEPLLVFWQSLQRLFQKVIEVLEGKINGQALGAALRHSFGRSDGQTQAQARGVSFSAAVAAGRERLGLRRVAVTLGSLLWYWLSSIIKKTFYGLQILGQESAGRHFFMWNKFSNGSDEMCYRPMQRASTGSIFRACLSLWV